MSFAGILEQGIHIDSLNMSRAFTTFESNVLFALRFMIDHDVVGGNWVELPAGHHTFQGPGHQHKLSHCQLEAHIHCSKVISHKPEGIVGTLAVHDCTQCSCVLPPVKYWVFHVSEL